VAKTDNNVLMLTIPYSKGFSVKVNGKNVKAGKILDAFMTIPLEKGNNVIKLRYIPCGIKPALLLFLSGIFLLLIYLAVIKKKKYIKIIALENILYYSFSFFAVIVFIGIYIFPMIVYIFSLYNKK